MTSPREPQDAAAVLERWPKLNAAWVVVDGERVGWIGENPGRTNAYNLAQEHVGWFPDTTTAVAALKDPRAENWREWFALRSDLRGGPLPEAT